MVFEGVVIALEDVLCVGVANVDDDAWKTVGVAATLLVSNLPSVLLSTFSILLLRLRAPRPADSFFLSVFRESETLGFVDIYSGVTGISTSLNVPEVTIEAIEEVSLAAAADASSVGPCSLFGTLLGESSCRLKLPLFLFFVVVLAFALADGGARVTRSMLAVSLFCFSSFIVDR